MTRRFLPLDVVLDIIGGMGLLCSQQVSAQVNVTTYHYDRAGTGQNLSETTLTPANVNPAQFGKLFSYPVDGFVYTQPLYLSGVSTPGSAGGARGLTATQGVRAWTFDKH